MRNRPSRSCRSSGQMLRRLAIAAQAHQHVGFQQAALGLQLAGQRLPDQPEISQRRFVVPALVTDARQIEAGPVAHGVRHRTREQAIEDALRLGVQAERQVQAARQQFGFGRVMAQAAEVAGRFQPHDRFEVVVLEEMEQHVAVVEIAQLRGWRRGHVAGSSARAVHAAAAPSTRGCSIGKPAVENR